MLFYNILFSFSFLSSFLNDGRSQCFFFLGTKIDCSYMVAIRRNILQIQRLKIRRSTFVNFLKSDKRVYLRLFNREMLGRAHLKQIWLLGPSVRACRLFFRIKTNSLFSLFSSLSWSWWTLRVLIKRFVVLETQNPTAWHTVDYAAQERQATDIRGSKD